MIVICVVCFLIGTVGGFIITALGAASLVRGSIRIDTSRDDTDILRFNFTSPIEDIKRRKCVIFIVKNNSKLKTLREINNSHNGEKKGGSHE